MTSKPFRAILNFLATKSKDFMGDGSQGEKAVRLYQELWPKPIRTSPLSGSERRAQRRQARKVRVRELKAQRRGRTKRQHSHMIQCWNVALRTQERA